MEAIHFARILELFLCGVTIQKEKKMHKKNGIPIGQADGFG